MNQSQLYVQKLISDRLLFEKEVLHVNCDADRKEIVTLISKELCYEDEISKKISFLKINSIDELDFTGVNIAFVQILLLELISLLEERGSFVDEIEGIKKDKILLKFIYELVQTYMSRFGSTFYAEVVNTFFDLIALANKPQNLHKIVNEVILGSGDKQSLIVEQRGGRVLNKSEQAWMRVKQARDDKNRRIKSYQVDITNLIKKIDNIKLHISAMVAANALSIDDIKNISARLLLDMFSDNAEVTLHIKKTMFSYISSQELLDILIKTAQKAILEPKYMKDRSSFKKIEAFFKKCKMTNTKNHLESNFDKLKQELHQKSEKYRHQRLKLQTLKDRPLDSFDDTLKRIKKAIVYNLEHF